MAGRLRPRFRRKAAAVTVSALVIVGALAALVATRSPAVAATSGVTITSGGCAGGGTSYCYGPETLTVAVGDTVTWTNMSGFSHTATSCTASACGVTNTGSDTFDKSIAASNGSTNSFIFMNPGMYTYYCTVHGYTAMHATVTVTGTPPTPTPTPTPAILPPKIKSFSPTSGPVGTTVTILGAHLKNATVKFNGTTATLVTDAGKKIVAKVPTGATTGKISVMTPGGTVMSSITFTVT